MSLYTQNRWNYSKSIGCIIKFCAHTFLKTTLDSLYLPPDEWKTKKNLDSVFKNHR